MSSLDCPYCEIKEVANAKTTFQPLRFHQDGTKCPDCGAYLDAGQKRIDVNSYVDIYKGALRLMDRMKDEFNYWLDYMGIEVEDYLLDGQEKALITISTSEIIDELFLGKYGGTTKRNFIKALDIEEDEVEFEICRENPWN